MGEAEEAISVADAAIIVVNCKAGIEPGTERAWEMCEKYNLPRLIFVTNMDDDHASYRELVVSWKRSSDVRSLRSSCLFVKMKNSWALSTWLRWQDAVLLL